MAFALSPDYPVDPEAFDSLPDVAGITIVARDNVPAPGSRSGDECQATRSAHR
jgi:hypothetical protein